MHVKLAKLARVNDRLLQNPHAIIYSTPPILLTPKAKKFI